MRRGDCPRPAELPRASTSAVVGVGDEQFLLSLLLWIFQRYNDEHVLFFSHHKNLRFFTEKPGTGLSWEWPGSGGGQVQVAGLGDSPVEWQGPVGRLQPRPGLARPLLGGCLELGRSLLPHPLPPLPRWSQPLA